MLTTFLSPYVGVCEYALCVCVCIQGQEPINFGDVLCQLVDMINPADPVALTLQDMTKPAKRSFSGKKLYLYGICD